MTIIEKVALYGIKESNMRLFQEVCILGFFQRQIWLKQGSLLEIKMKSCTSFLTWYLYVRRSTQCGMFLYCTLNCCSCADNILGGYPYSVSCSYFDSSNEAVQITLCSTGSPAVVSISLYLSNIRCNWRTTITRWLFPAYSYCSVPWLNPFNEWRLWGNLIKKKKHYKMRCACILIYLRIRCKWKE